MATAASPAQAFTAPSGSTLRSWITTVDHKRIGLLYLLVTMFFFLTGGLMALVIRLQLETASGTVVSAETYDRIFTMHGTTMVFLFVVPVMAAFGNYMVPLQIGARDMAFPKLNAASFWLLLFGGMTMYSSFGFGGAPDAGWTGYPPLSVISPGHGIDFWIVGLHILSLSSILGAINFICTIHNMRAPGMRLTRMPLFTWCIDFYSIMIVGALPVLSGALTMLLLDRNYGTPFFTANGGNPGALPALLLFLRPPRGVRGGAPRVRHDLRDPAGVRAQADLRLQSAGLLGGGDRVPGLPGLGPPHVRGRILDAGQHLVHGRVARDRCAHRRQDLQLDRHPVDGPDPL